MKYLEELKEKEEDDWMMLDEIRVNKEDYDKSGDAEEIKGVIRDVRLRNGKGDFMSLSKNLKCLKMKLKSVLGRGQCFVLAIRESGGFNDHNLIKDKSKEGLV